MAYLLGSRRAWSTLTAVKWGGCKSIPEAPCMGRPDYQWSNCNFAARSRHAGGVNGVMLDGAVKFFGNGIDLAVRRAIASIDGGEPPSPDF